MNYTLKELLDIPRLQNLMDLLDEVHGLPSAIIDIEGNILTATAWQEICTKFHRVNPDTQKKCIESDRHIKATLGDDVSPVFYSCPMGLLESASPIIIDGKHLGNVFIGQFFGEPPDVSYFKEQARQYGFDENKYLAAMLAVPQFSEEKLRKKLSLIRSLAQMLAEQGLQHKRQRDAEKVQKEAAAEWRKTFDTVPDPVAIIAPDYTVLKANRAFAELVGKNYEELVGMKCFSMVHGCGTPLTGCPLSKTLTDQTKHLAEIYESSLNKHLHISATPMFDDDGKFTGAVHVIHDITEFKLNEEALSRSEERLRLVLKGTNDALWDWNLENNELYYSSNWWEMLGYEVDVLPPDATLWERLMHTDDADRTREFFAAALKSCSDVYEAEFRLLHKEGHYVPVLSRGFILRDTNGNAVRVSGTNSDLTERKRAEEEKKVFQQQIQQSQKLESLGVLAGGIAHDFNNILAIINGYCYLLKMDYGTAENLIPDIERAVERAAGLCRQMLAYAGKAPLDRTEVNVALLVDEMVNMLKMTLNQNAVIRFDCLSDIPFVKSDASQLSQVVMNLIINASEAINEAQGEILVSLAKTEVKAGRSDKDHLGKAIPPGGYLCLEVTDTGCGMDDETKQRIFEPFYTTKFAGRGLGMSAVLGIITAHNGALQISSQPGQGATFKVYLPVSKDFAGEVTVQQVPVAPWQGSGTILLVEDEEQIRLIAKFMLKKLGFTVIEASNGKEALELYQKNGADISLVMTDMGMPVMDGYEMFGELKKLDQKLPIIISSGFGNTVVASRIAHEDIAGLVSKPYSFDQLRDVVKSVVKDGHPV